MEVQSLESRKLNLIVRISKLDKEEFVRQIENAVNILETKEPSERQLEMLEKIAKPIRKKTTIDDLIKEQNWKPINREEFDKLVKEIDIQEPLEQLIADIGK